MADPRLCGDHLELPRRDHYGAAREALLAARGELTLAAEDEIAALRDPHRRTAPPPGTDRPGTPYFLHDWQTGACYPLRVGLNTLGRFANNDVVPPEGPETNSVSRRHCVLLVHATGGFELFDTASRNGTFVNGYRLTRPVWLAPRDVVRVARWPLQFVCAEERGPAANRPAANRPWNAADTCPDMPGG